MDEKVKILLKNGSSERTLSQPGRLTALRLLCLSYRGDAFQGGESQNHRIVGVGRDLCGSSSPTPLPKALSCSPFASLVSHAPFWSCANSSTEASPSPCNTNVTQPAGQPTGPADLLPHTLLLPRADKGIARRLSPRLWLP